MIEVFHADCLEHLKSISDCHFDAIITDPPYGLAFMGKEWDKSVPSVSFWEEFLRVAKPGAFMLTFGGTRTYHRIACNVEDAGWEIRDCLMWVYGSGFPKSKGCLKPAYEPILLARKKGASPLLRIDACRIPTLDKLSGGTINGPTTVSKGWDRPWRHDEDRKEELIKKAKDKIAISESLGRWPANIIFDEEAAEMLDEQSGFSKSPKIGSMGGGSNRNKVFGDFAGIPHENGHGDSGGASRFFYCAKASPSERNGSSHPTMKPLRLMEYLIKLITPPGGLILDPFAGSGTTLLAAKNLGFNAIGIEREKEYCDIAAARTESNQMEMEFV